MRADGIAPDAGHGLPDAVARLGRDGGLVPHHLEAARRLARLFERARLAQRVTMSYDPARIGGAKGRPVQGELADSAAEARHRLGALAEALPAECWGVLADVCGFDKGLQQIEAERGWPRRSAKLVLRIALDQLAAGMGLMPQAHGREHGRQRHWLPERPPMFPEG